MDTHSGVNYPFPTVSAALNGPEQWCDVLILHIKTKYRLCGGTRQTHAEATPYAVRGSSLIKALTVSCWRWLIVGRQHFADTRSGRRPLCREGIPDLL